MGVFGWAPSPAKNAGADPQIQSLDGASGRSVAGSLRAIMAAIRTYADATGGALVTGGHLNAYTLNTGTGLTELRPGLSLVVRADRTNTAEASLNVDGLGPLPWVDGGGTPLEGERILQGRYYQIVLDPDAPAWRLNAGASSLDEIPGLIALRQEVAGNAADTSEKAQAAQAAATLADQRAGSADANRQLAQAARAGAETAQGSAQAARVGAESAQFVAVVERQAAETARLGSEAARDQSATASGAAQNAAVLSSDARAQAQTFAATAAAAASTAAAKAGLFDTLSALIAITPPTVITSAEVTDDPDPAKRGTYLFNPAQPTAGVSGWVLKSTATTPGNAGRLGVLEGRVLYAETPEIGAVKDSRGSKLLRFFRDGSVGARALRLTFEGHEGSILPLYRSLARVIYLGIEKRTGRLSFIPMAGLGMPIPRGEAQTRLYVLHDKLRRTLLRIGIDGRTWLKLHDDVITDIAARLPAGGSSTAAVGPEVVPEGTGFTEVYGATQVAPSLVRYLALDTASGATSLRGFHSRLDLLSSTAIREAPGPMIFALHIGDSTSVGGSQVQEDPLVHPVAPLLRDAMMFNVGARPNVGVYTLDPAAVTDLVPLREASKFLEGNTTGYGETVGSGCAAMAAQLLATAGKRRRTFAYCTLGQAGYEIAEVGPGTLPWTNLATAIGCAIRLAKAYGRRPEFVLFATIGVNDRSQRTAAYIQSRIATLQSAGQAEIQAQMTAAGLVAPSVVRMIVSQMAAPTNNLPVFAYPQMEIAVGQEAAVAASNGAIVMHAGRAYLKDAYGIRDTLHPLQRGYSVEAEFFAKALMWEAVNGTAWTGCRPQTVTRSGTTVVIDCYGVGDLVRDVDYWPAATADGFSAGDDSGPIAITSVAKTGPRQITVTLAAAPTGANPFVAYAYANGAGASGRPGTWGNWRDSDATPSLTVPGLLLRNPLCTFKRPI